MTFVFFIISTTIITVTVASSTKTTHPTTMPTMQPDEHPPPEPDGAGSGSVLWELESTSIVDVVSGTVVSAVDIVTVVDSENKN